MAVADAMKPAAEINRTVRRSPAPSNAARAHQKSSTIVAASRVDAIVAVGSIERGANGRADGLPSGRYSVRSTRVSAGASAERMACGIGTL